MDLETSIKSNLKKILSNQKKLHLDIDNIDTLVLSGGGVKGLYYIGILKKLEDLNILKNINKFAGTSIGAFFAALISINFSSKDLIDFILLFNLSKIKKIKTSNFFSFFGIDDGNNLEIILENMFETKGHNKNSTFKELYEKTKKELIISGVCINEKKCHYFSYKNTPNMSVIKAIRISTSIPIYFTPVLYDSKLWVDGAIIDNYPIHLFKHRLNKTLGIYLNENRENCNINNLEEYFMCIIESLLEGLANKSISGYENNTVIINSENINLINTDLSQEQIFEFINIGYETISNSLN
jgi:NTE family protein